ncbi:MAG: TonB-dependent receptor [Tannerella sp.]|jgi:TonB-linked SusC/RagA family outer membrane protein|nr:TonB-dependent receptor [Tannerella sp.]
MRKHALILWILYSGIICFGQEQSVRTGNAVVGVVTDGNGEALSGATVWVKETSIGVICDIDGKYTIHTGNVKNPVLVASFVGYNAVEEVVNNRAEINFALEESTVEIEEVAVVAYGMQKKESVVGAITALKPAQLKLPAGQVSTVLAGQLGGVISIQRTGEPGESAQFWIRGVSTMTGSSNKPLVLIDGIERELDLVDVEDIETFSVLKDATATAIYGVRGANGVLLITTRSGVQGPAKVTVRAESGVVSATRLPRMADATQYAELYNEAYSYTSDGGKYLFDEATIEKIRSGEDPDLYPNVNWVKEMFKTASFNQRVNVNLNGGGSIARYFISGTYYHEGSIYKQDNTQRYNTSIDYDKFNFRSNVDVNLTLSTLVNVNLSNIYETRVSPNSGKDDMWSRAFTYAPGLAPAVYSDGTLSAYPGGGQNPYNLLTQNGFKNEYWNNAQSLLGLKQDLGELITKGLEANVKFSWDVVTHQTVHYSRTPNTFYAYGRDDDGSLLFSPVVSNGTETLGYSKSSSGNKTVYLEASLNYSRLFDSHRLGALLLYNQKSKRYIQADNIDESVPYRNQGIAGRFTYGFNDRYFLEGNFGYNGSENFSPGRRFGFFPSIALGWIVSDENFFGGLTGIINKLKIRGSYGLVGNDNIGLDDNNDNIRFIYHDSFDMNVNNAYALGQQSTTKTGARISNYGSPNVSWEKSHKLDIGLEISLFKQVNIQADYFRDYRTDIFLQRNDLTYIAGIATLPYVNMGEALNRGVDLQLESFHEIDKLQISFRGNFTYNRNKVLKNAQPQPEYPYLSKIGLPVDQQVGYVAMGLFTSQEEIDQSPPQYGTLRIGDVKYKDINGDGVINSYDQVPTGYTWVPEITYGFGMSSQWKNFDLSCLFQGVSHTTMFLSGTAFRVFSGAGEAASGFYEDVFYHSWRLDNPDPNATYPRATIGTNTNNNLKSTFWQRDVSYMRLKNVTLGYTFPKRLTTKTGLQSLRLYCSGVNLLTFSAFKLFDPEIDDQQGSKYPPNRIINFGINMDF